MGYRKPQDRNVTLKYKKHFKRLQTYFYFKKSTLAFVYTVQTTIVIGLNTKRWLRKPIIAAFEQTIVLRMCIRTHG